MQVTKAKELLESGDYTLVLTDGTEVITSRLRGVRPLVQLLEKGDTPKGLYAADKVVGRATAYLYVLLGIRELYTKVISEPAMAVLNAYEIPFRYDSAVPNVINRTGDGICPFEMAVIDIDEPRAAYAAILKKMAEMNIPIGE